LRRLIRRAVRYAKMIGINIKKSVTPELAKVVVETLGEVYPEIKTNEKRIYNELEQEENKFGQTLEKGLKEFNKLKEITGKEAFILFSTYGFPLELTEELAREKGFQVNREEFQKEFQKHQELSRTASAGMFKGGLADAGEIAVKYHTATHLLHAALRQVLGDHVFQKGSNINSERLRFDFSHPDKMTPEQIKQVEDLVNKQIQEGSEVKIEELSVEQAKAAGAIGVFEHKYGDKVKVYSVGDFSKEICGGPHVANLKELGHFKILKEESSSAGVRRIKAVLE
jgi:alanyl-tRNA synthetase